MHGSGVRGVDTMVSDACVAGVDIALLDRTTLDEIWTLEDALGIVRDARDILGRARRGSAVLASILGVHGIDCESVR